jgi:hypothetical protein
MSPRRCPSSRSGGLSCRLDGGPGKRRPSRWLSGAAARPMAPRRWAAVEAVPAAARSNAGLAAVAGAIAQRMPRLTFPAVAAVGAAMIVLSFVNSLVQFVRHRRVEGRRPWRLAVQARRSSACVRVMLGRLGRVGYVETWDQVDDALRVETAMCSRTVVVLQPAGEDRGAFRRGVVRADVRPLPQGGLNEALRRRGNGCPAPAAGGIAARI